MTKASKAYPELKTIRKDIDHLKDDAAELAQHVKEHGAHRAEAMKERASEAYSGLLAEGASDIKKLEKYVTANPAQSVAMAFAAGVFASFFLGRR